jgi:hypothetical protein
MRMADAGYRRACNGQLATDTESQIVVAVDVTTQGSDHGQVEPMREQIERRYGVSPGAMLVDGGFVSLADFDRVERRGCRIYAPPMQRPRPARPRDRRRHRRDTPALSRWRRRMRTRAAKAIYRLRAATAECVNAIARRRGLVQARSPRTRQGALRAPPARPHPQLLASPRTARHACIRLSAPGAARAHLNETRTTTETTERAALARTAAGRTGSRFLLRL